MKPVRSFCLRSIPACLFIHLIALSAPTLQAAPTTDGLVGYWTLDGNVEDTSGNAHHGTPTDITPVTGFDGTPNGAYAFNGTSSRVQFATTELLRPGQFTLSAWVKMDPGQAQFGGIVSGIYHNHSSDASGWGLNSWASDDATFPASFSAEILNKPTGNFGPISAPNLDDGTWHHVVTSWDGSNWRFWLNGVADHTIDNSPHEAQSGDVRYNTPYQGLHFGVRTTGNLGSYAGNPVEYFFRGALDEVRLYNRALSEAEVTELYADATGLDTDLDGLPDAWEIEHFGNLTASDGTGDHDRDGRTDAEELADNTDPSNPGSTLGLVAYYPFDGNAEDASGNGYHGSVEGATLTTDAAGNPNKAYAFDGVDDHIMTSLGSNWTTNEFTIQCWVKFDTFETNYPHIAHGENCYLIFHGSGPAYIQSGQFGRVSAYQNCGANDRVFQAIFTTHALDEGDFYHLAIVKTATTAQHFVNGVLNAEVPLTTNQVVSGTRLAFGGWETQGAALDGVLDDIRLYNRALSEAEVARLYAETAAQPGNQINQPLTANAGPDLAATDTDGDGFATVILDASASTDSDGTITNYAWSWVDGNGDPQTASGVTAQATFPVGTTTVTLTVTDNDGATATDTTMVVVEPSERVFVEGGSFTMGDEFGDGDSDELPLHEVTLSSFAIGRYEVTKALWDEVATWAAANGYDIGASTASAHGGGGDYPAHSVTWYEVVKWCNARSEREGLTPCYKVGTEVYRTADQAPTCDFSASGYRLPTEAEWEYAAKGGKNGTMTKYAGSDNIDAVALYNSNSGSTSHPVGTKQANELGLYDISGNIWEWCWDWYGSYSIANAVDPPGPGTGSSRVDRGGSWSDRAQDCRVAIRGYGSPGLRYYNVGFRLARSVIPPTANAGPDLAATDTDGDGFAIVTLDASASADSDGTITNYAWSWTDGNGDPQTASGVTAQANFPVGTTAVTLTVTDNDGATMTDTVEVEVVIRYAYWTSNEDGVHNLYRGIWVGNGWVNREQITFFSTPEYVVDFGYNRQLNQLGIVKSIGSNRGDGRFYLANPNGTDLRRISDFPVKGPFDFSPDGTTIVCSRAENDQGLNQQVAYFLDLNSGRETLFLGSNAVRGTNTHKTSFAWLPDNSILYGTTRVWSDFWGQQDLYIYRDGLNSPLASNTTTGEWMPFISPDGTKILVLHGSGTSNRIGYIGWPVDDGITAITAATSSGTYPSGWIDADTVAYGENGDIYTVNLDGSNQTNLTNTSGVSEYRLRLYSLSASSPLVSGPPPPPTPDPTSPPPTRTATGSPRLPLTPPARPTPTARSPATRGPGTVAAPAA